MIYIVDYYDSFVYNLSAYLRELGEAVVVRRADRVTLKEIHQLKPDGLLLSPGPRRPSDAVVSHQVLREMAGQVPILGVCLGHQVIGQFYGATVCHGKKPMHGKCTKITHDGSGIFAGLPHSFSVTRYHSLIVSAQNFPSALRVTAKSEDGVIMGLQHRTLPIYGVQFHPEAVLSQYGHELLQNFRILCKEWRDGHV
ncbi:MAG: aminodeoxychorismate/anthranilate synthase component II [Oscillospiraceae bacterium]|nr:aminodeoxychorismate/anthranilate synthase component II [Oscillospiraceae bacterium]